MPCQSHSLHLIFSMGVCLLFLLSHLIICFIQILPEDAVTLATRCDDQQKLLEEIEAKGNELEAVESTGAQFMASAKVK